MTGDRVLKVYLLGALHYSGCQKNVPMAERFFSTTLMPPSFLRNIIMTSGITLIYKINRELHPMMP